MSTTSSSLKHRSRVLSVCSIAATACLPLALLAAPPATAKPEKQIQVIASIQASSPAPATHECKDRQGVAGIPFTNTAILGTAAGDSWHSVGLATDTTCVYPTPEGVFYTGTETGIVTIDGCGTGFVVLKFKGSVNGAVEESTATLQPGKGTGDLKGVSGTVTSRSTLNPDFSANGQLTGAVHCPHPTT